MPSFSSSYWVQKRVVRARSSAHTGTSFMPRHKMTIFFNLCFVPTQFTFSSCDFFALATISCLEAQSHSFFAYLASLPSIQLFWGTHHSIESLSVLWLGSRRSVSALQSQYGCSKGFEVFELWCACGPGCQTCLQVLCVHRACLVQTQHADMEHWQVVLLCLHHLIGERTKSKKQGRAFHQMAVWMLSKISGVTDVYTEKWNTQKKTKTKKNTDTHTIAQTENIDPIQSNYADVKKITLRYNLRSPMEWISGYWLCIKKSWRKKTSAPFMQNKKKSCKKLENSTAILKKT